MGDTRRVRFDADGGGAAGGGGGGDGGGGDGERKAADDEKTTALHPARFADGQTGKDVGGSAARRFRVNLGQRSRFGVNPSRFLSLSLSLSLSLVGARAPRPHWSSCCCCCCCCCSWELRDETAGWQSSALRRRRRVIDQSMIAICAGSHDRAKKVDKN